MSTVNDWLKSSSLKLKTISDSPFIDAELLLLQVLKLSKEKLFLKSKKILSPAQLKKLNCLLEKRQAGIPIAYLSNQKSFYGLDFFVNKDVLIPRPDSETIVDLGLEVINGINNPTIVELGVGSGALIISLIKNYQGKCRAFGYDISQAALKIAKENLKAQKLNRKILLKKSNLLQQWPKNRTVDLLIANLPYLPASYLKTHAHKSEIGLKFEPKISLFSGRDGLEHYRKLKEQLASYKVNKLIIECLPQQIKKLVRLYSNKEYSCTVKKDLGGTERFIIINKNNHA